MKFLDWLVDRPYRTFTLMGSVFGVAIGGLLLLAGHEQKQWEAFAQTHECKVVGKIAGHTAYGYYNGKYQHHWVPSKTVYKCNDGIEYTR
jgi:hypothetical protein